MALGYDKKLVYQNLLLGLTLEEMIGLVAHDRAKPHHACDLHGPPVWAALANDYPYLEFDPGDWLDCCAGAGSPLNFQAGDFSMAVWVNVDDITVDRTLFCRGLADNDGWYFFISNTNGRLFIATCQGGGAAATQASFGSINDVIVGTWVLAGATRSGEHGNLYSNGRLTTDGPQTHIDPDSSARELHIGILDDETTEPFDGKMAYPRIWDRELSAEEMLSLFEAERHLFGV